MNLPYNIILISHEDMSKDITKRTGDKITAIKPNIQDKIANKIAGMVDIVCRVLVEDDGRYLSFKSDQVVFGGGRLKASNKTMIPLSWESIEDFYTQIGASDAPAQPEKAPEAPAEPVAERVEVVIGEGHSESVALVDDQSKRRTRRTRS